MICVSMNGNDSEQNVCMARVGCALPHAQNKNFARVPTFPKQFLLVGVGGVGFIRQPAWRAVDPQSCPEDQVLKVSNDKK